MIIDNRNRNILLAKNITRHSLSIAKNSLYFPYTILIAFYLLFLFMVFGSFVDEIGFGMYLEKTIIYFFELIINQNLFEININNVISFFIYGSIIFGIILDVIFAIIRKRKKISNLIINLKILKYTLYFYVITALISLIISLAFIQRGFSVILFMTVALIFINIITFSCIWSIDFLSDLLLSTRKEIKKIEDEAVKDKNKFIVWFILFFFLIGMGFLIGLIPFTKAISISF